MKKILYLYIQCMFLGQIDGLSRRWHQHLNDSYAISAVTPHVMDAAYINFLFLYCINTI